MKVAYIDTSCLVAVAFGEPGHQDMVERLRSQDRVVSSTLLEAELSAALLREGVPVSSARGLCSNIDWILPQRPLSSEFRSVLGAGYVRGADLWHLACALFVSPDPSLLSFLTLDQRQAEVAAALRFRVS